MANRRRKNELTPQQIIALRKGYPNDGMGQYEFIHDLKRRGYVHVGEGSFKEVYRMPRGRYVVKTCMGVEPGHMSGAIRSYARSRPARQRKMLKILAHTSDVHVQLAVKECIREDCHVKGFWDTWGHNHTHTKNGRTLVFDY